MNVIKAQRRQEAREAELKQRIVRLRETLLNTLRIFEGFDGPQSKPNRFSRDELLRMILAARRTGFAALGPDTLPEIDEAQSITAETPLAYLQLDVRIFNALDQLGFRTVGVLLAADPEELKEIPNINVQSLKHIAARLHAAGFAWGPELHAASGTNASGQSCAGSM